MLIQGAKGEVPASNPAKTSRVLTIILMCGVLLAAIGTAAIALSPMPKEGAGTITVPVGDRSFGVMSVSSWRFGGSLSGNFTIDRPGSFELLVLDEFAYHQLITAGVINATEGFWGTMGNNTSIPASFPVKDKYYFVVGHGFTDPNLTITARVSYRLTGIELRFLLGGIGCLAAGLATSLIAFRKKRVKDMEFEPSIPFD